MNQHIQAEEQRNMATYVQTDASEEDMLVQCGFSTEEIMALLLLRGWYQTGGSDRIPLIRHWEFLKWLVMSGTLEA